MKICSQHVGVYCRDIDESIKFYVDTLGFDHLYSTEAVEGDKPLKMAWLRSDGGLVIELLEQFDKSTIDATANCLNHIAIRTTDMDAFVKHLKDHGVEIEAGPFDNDMLFDHPLSEDEQEIFTTCGADGCKIKIMFFRGPGNERFEVVQDNIAKL